MKLGTKTKLTKAFADSSTDEPHHCKNSYRDVDRVALSTNRFYMIDSLRPPRTVSSLDVLVQLADGMTLEKALRKFGREMSFNEAAFVSFYDHCMNHIIIPPILRACHLIKAMSKMLSTKTSNDYVDLINQPLADAYEAIAYAAQVLVEAVPKELRESILDCLGRDSAEIYAKRCESLDLILDRELSLLKSHGSTGYSQLILKAFVPSLARLIRLDDEELLSQFSFGIISIFDLIPPQLYFVKDIETLDGKRLGHCQIPHAMGIVPQIKDMLILPRHEIEQAPNSDDEGLSFTNFIRENYIEPSQEYNIGWAYYAAVCQIWRETLRYGCPCAYAESRVTDCPCQGILYRSIRSFFMLDREQRDKVCRRYLSGLEHRLNYRISPWTGTVELLGWNRQVVRLMTHMSSPVATGRGKLHPERRGPYH
jgi:hypothetical protein